MQQSYRYLKGQVWFWEDPTYGRKNGKSIDKNEGGLRYSRYVLIMQNTSAIQDSVLVIPLSSNKRYSSSVEVNLFNRSNSTISYVRVEKMFPINPAALNRYVCTLHPDVMNEIYKKLKSLIIDDHCEEIVELERTEKKDSIEEPVERKFDTDFEGVTHVHKERAVVNWPIKKDKPSKTKWTDNAREEFLADYDQMTTDELASKYRIGRSSVYRYHALFTRTNKTAIV